MHVLLVEDDPLTSLMTAHALRRQLGVRRVSVAVDGQDAFDRLASGAITPERLVILTDLSMPRMSGLDLVAAIASLPAFRSSPVAVLTTSNSPSDRAAAVALHVAGYFVKSAGRGYLDAMLGWLRAYGLTLPPCAPT
jgi:CheY-like chemotaxis protein